MQVLLKTLGVAVLDILGAAEEENSKRYRASLYTISQGQRLQYKEQENRCIFVHDTTEQGALGMW